MTSSRAQRYLIASTLLAAASTSILLAATSSSGSAPKPAGPATSSTSQPWTPNDCIRLNGGDYNACNVGNSGGGDLPYTIAKHETPNDCIRLNGGDYTACNVGNSGRGDLPYRRVPAH